MADGWEDAILVVMLIGFPLWTALLGLFIAAVVETGCWIYHKLARHNYRWGQINYIPEEE